jgi:phosphate-selective porin OprO/OprP
MAITLMPSPVIAEGFLLGEETKGFTISLAEHTNLTIRFILQPRLDFGDLTTSRDARRYESETDFYLRAVRLLFEGSLIKNLTYAVHLSADKWQQKGHDDEVELFYAFVDYKFLDEFSARAGKAKLPYSRVSLTSIGKQLLVERPVSTEAAKKVFDKYLQPYFFLHGRFLEGILAYDLALADGWEEGKTLRPGNSVHKANPLFVGRIELSPPGWIEEKKSDAYLGRGRHITLGVHYAIQNSIEYRESFFEEDRDLFGFDLSGHWQGITAQFEYNQWREDFSNPAKRSKEPRGWYLQAGYFIREIKGIGINLEPVARYEEYDQDSNISDKKEKVRTVGATWYAKGHSLKIGANWAHTTFERQAGGRLVKDNKKDVFQIQVQLYF